jgi:hypothetical protein
MRNERREMRTEKVECMLNLAFSPNRLLRYIFRKRWKRLLYRKMLRRHLHHWLLRIVGEGSVHRTLHHQCSGLVSH